MISVRSRGTTHLCLEGDSYTGFYTVLNVEAESTTHLTVLCSISSFNQDYTKNDAAPFSFRFVSPLKRRNGGFYVSANDLHSRSEDV